MMYENIEAADKMMATLSDMLRSTLRIKTEEHTVKEELHLLDQYLEIMKMRFKEKLDIEVIQIDDIEKAILPVLLLQPLTENSIKYGTEKKEQVKIKIEIKKEGEKLYISIDDNGPGIKDTSRKGIGWNNTIERLEKHFGDNQEFILENKKEGGLNVTLKIPLRFQV